jgi:ankyrin repeat protein
MNAFGRIMLALAMACAPAAAMSQAGGYEADQFVAAIRKGDAATALKLLEERPNLVNARDLNGNTALMVAMENRDIEWVGHLLRQGANTNQTSKSGETPLILASKLGMQDVVTWLLGLGARVDETNRSGETALIVAVRERQVPIVKLLLNAGANPDHTDSVAGYSARDYAKRDNRTPELLRLIEAKKPAG